MNTDMQGLTNQAGSTVMGAISDIDVNTRTVAMLVYDYRPLLTLESRSSVVFY